MSSHFTLLAFVSLAALTSLAPASQKSQVLRPKSLKDAAMGIERSHTLLLPDGWSMEGGAVWTPQETAISHLVLDLWGPDGAGVTFHRSGVASVMDSNMPLATGADEATGLRADSTVGELAVEQILKRKRSGARRVKVVKTSTVSPMLDVYKGLFGATARQLEIQGTQTYGAEQTTTRVHLDVPRVRVTYREGGEVWEEEFLFYLMAVDTRSQSNFGGWYSSRTWSYSSPVSIRARKGNLDDARPLLLSIVNSVQPTREWSHRRHVMNVAAGRKRHQSSMQTLEALRRSAKQIARSDSRVREQAASSWRQQQATRDASLDAVVDAFRGVEQYRLPDGSTMALDAGYARAYTDGDGAFLLTDDVLNDPRIGSDVEWKQLEMVERRR